MMYTVIAWNIDESNLGLMGYHKSIGFCLLVLCVIRIIWAIKSHKTRLKSDVLVRFSHVCLYVLMFAVPMIGVLRQYGAAKQDLLVFGIHVIQAADEKINWMTQLGNSLHGKLGFALFVLMLGHILMAIVHQLRGEKILHRMLGKPKR